MSAELHRWADDGGPVHKPIVSRRTSLTRSIEKHRKIWQYLFYEEQKQDDLDIRMWMRQQMKHLDQEANQAIRELHYLDKERSQ